MVRVLVVDDSAFMRKALTMMLESDPAVRVVDTAKNGEEALQKIPVLKPDVVTLDVEMPRMDGLTALREIMKRHPCPVVMVSSLTRDGARVTVEALQAGAVDFIPKQHSYVSLGITKLQEDLVAKVKSAARSRLHLLRRRPGGPAPVSVPPRLDASLRLPQARLIVIGVSTGGPFALQHVLPKLPADLPVPVVVVQHMPPHFTRSLAERLNTMSPLTVVEAEDGMPLKPGMVAVAPGGRHLVFRRAPVGHVFATSEEPTEQLHRPSVDVTFNAAAEAFHGRVVGLVMTGMGRDGLEGARTIRDRGGLILAQDEATCVVYGMPRAVLEAGVAAAALSLDDLAPALVQAVARPGLAAAPLAARVRRA